MNSRHCFLIGLAVFFLLFSYSHGLAEDQATTLTVKEIAIKPHKSGEEKVAVLCNQACTPALSKLEGNKPRVIMDFAGISYMAPRYRHVPISGKYVKGIRSYLDPASKNLRVVLDMDPSRYYVVHPTQDQTTQAYTLLISEQRHEKSKYAKTSPGTAANRISIIDQGRRPIDKDLKPAEAETAVKQAPANVESLPEDKVSVERGRSQMNAGNYAGAINTFTELIAKNPKDSLSYRLRGNAYQNIGDRQKALGDWVTSARLGNEIAQSYLDFMQITWKEKSKP